MALSIGTFIVSLLFYIAFHVIDSAYLQRNQIFPDFFAVDLARSAAVVDIDASNVEKGVAAVQGFIGGGVQLVTFAISILWRLAVWNFAFLEGSQIGSAVRVIFSLMFWGSLILGTSRAGLLGSILRR